MGKVVLLCSSLGLGGLSEVVLYQYNLINKFSPGSVSILALKDQKNIKGKFRITGLIELIKSPPLLVITHGVLADVFGLFLSSFSINVYAHIHGYYPFHFKHEARGIKLGVLKFCSYLVVRNSKLILLDNQMLKFYSSISNQRKIVISNFYSELISSCYIKCGAGSELLNLRERGFKLAVAICGTSRRKGHDRVIKLAKSNLEYFILIFGQCNNSEVEQIPNVRYMGHSSVWLQYLSNSDCFIHLSRNEGSPLGVIKSLTTQKVLFLSNILAHRHFFSMPGVYPSSNFGKIDTNINVCRSFKTCDETFIQFVEDCANE